MNERQVTVQGLITAHTDLRPIAGRQGLDRPIRCDAIQRLGIALAGYVEHLEPHRLQMMGRSEWGFLDTLPPEHRLNQLTPLVAVDFPALVLTAGLSAPPALRELSDSHGFVLLATEAESAECSNRLNDFLHRVMSACETRHGVLVDVFGIGILLVGKSGIGKSELGLELVTAGHRLVADDLVILRPDGPCAVTGSSPNLTRHHVEIRGLGILNIKDLYGAASVRDQKRVEMIIELVEWDAQADYDRLGLDTQYMALAGVNVEHLTLPLRSGRSMKMIIEVAARNRLLKVRGTDSAQAFSNRLDTLIAAGVDPLSDLLPPQETRSE